MGHIARDFPTSYSVSSQRVATFEPTIGDMGRAHMVFTVVDNRQAEHQATVIETIGMIRGSSVSILFDFGATDSFISPFIVE